MIVLWPLVTSYCYASNYHDHLYSLPSARAFVEVADEIFALPARSTKLKEYFSGERGLSDLIFYLRVMLQLNENQIQRVTSIGVEGSLKDLCAIISPQDPAAALQYLLEIDVDKSHAVANDKAAAKRAYVIVENIRRRLLLSLSNEGFGYIFDRFLVEEHPFDRQALVLSVPVQFYQGKQHQKLKAFYERAAMKNSDISYLLSIPRRTLLASGLDTIRSFEHDIRSGLIDGIDISSSMFEDADDLGAGDIKLVAQRFLELFRYCDYNNLQLRIHAFEAANSGPFYDGLKLAMKEFDLQAGEFGYVNLHFGHIAKLTPEWLSFVKNLVNFNPVFFEANIPSNLFLQDGPSEIELYRIVQTILEEDESFSVLFGADGRGILKGTAYLDQLERFLAAIGRMESSVIAQNLCRRLEEGFETYRENKWMRKRRGPLMRAR